MNHPTTRPFNDHFCLVCQNSICYNSADKLGHFSLNIIAEEIIMTKETPPAQEETKKVNRREFLNFAWLVSLGFLTVDMAGLTFFFAMPRFKPGEFGGVVTAGKVSELPELASGPENFPKVKFWLSHTDQGAYALYKVCTHLGCLYNWKDQDDKFVCPCHGSQFHKNGEYIQGPAPRSLDRFVLQFVDPNSGEVLSETPTDGGPAPVPDNPDAEIRVNTGERIRGKNHG
jgi:cytochrome b6-f complex iron-sulfur subunit